MRSQIAVIEGKVSIFVGFESLLNSQDQKISLIFFQILQQFLNS